MATWPAKTNYATGDVLTAAQMQDIGNALNSVGSAQYAAGKNKIINGDFNINQRAFTSTTTSLTYGFDRWFFAGDDGTTTYSLQTFTPGTAPVSGYEATNFARIASTGQTLTTARSALIQRIESVRTFAGQTATISFWAKAASGTPSVALELIQNFGSGGSPSSQVTGISATKVAITTSWARYSITVSVPSISGKTIGTTANTDFLGVQFYTSAGSTYDARTGTLGIQTATIDFWGIQAEAGSVATPFQTATGTLAGELAACQRYLPAIYGATNTMFGYAYSTTGSQIYVKLPVTARVAPTGITANGTFASNYALVNQGFTSGTPTAIAFNASGVDFASFNVTTTAGTPTLVLGQPVQFQTNSNNGYILFTGCEL